MKTITVQFQDDPAAPTEGLRESVTAIAENHGAQLTDVSPSKVSIVCSGLPVAQEIWVDLQAVAGIQISNNFGKGEHALLAKAVADASAKKESGGRRGRRSDAA